MLCSYGGPRQPDDVLPFLRNATRGKGIPDERLIQVGGHYSLFGGKSPINECNDEFSRALAGELEQRGVKCPVVVGNRNWHPYFTETLTSLIDLGHRTVLCVFTSAFASYSGCRQYREDLAAALDELGDKASELVLTKVRPYYTTHGILSAHVRSITRAMRELDDPHLVLVTHSIPVSMEANSGDHHLPTYVGQHHQLGEEICRRVSDELGREVPFDLAYCSRSGPPQSRWLEPDINDHLEFLHDGGMRAVVVAPIGFISDHMEVVYDLDTEAKATADNLGMDYRRAATPGTDPAFVSSLADVVCERIGSGAAGDAIDIRWPVTCSQECCLPRESYQMRPTCFNHPNQGETHE